jgi:hypothetical protein
MWQATATSNVVYIRTTTVTNTNGSTILAVSGTWDQTGNRLYYFRGYSYALEDFLHALRMHERNRAALAELLWWTVFHITEAEIEDHRQRRLPPVLHSLVLHGLGERLRMPAPRAPPLAGVGGSEDVSCCLTFGVDGASRGVSMAATSGSEP